jgi:hypothetical protein
MTPNRLDPTRKTTRPHLAARLAGAVMPVILSGGMLGGGCLAHAEALRAVSAHQAERQAETTLAADNTPSSPAFTWRQPGEALNHIGTSLRGLWAQVQSRVHIVVDQPSAPQLADLEPELLDKPLRLRMAPKALSGDGEEGGFRALAGLVRGESSNWWLSHGEGDTGLNPSFQRLNASGLLSGSGLRPTDPTFLGTRPYLGAAFSTRLAYRGSPSLWRFNADLGLMSLNDSKNGPLGQVFSGERGLDELFHELRFRPNVKVSVGYSF